MGTVPLVEVQRAAAAMTQVLVADDHPLFREALKGAVRAAFPGVELAEAADVAGLFDLLEAHPHADLLLLDLNMPGAQGFSALIQVRRLRPGLPVVIVSAREEPTTISRALGHGAAGFIPKSARPDELCNALVQVLDGEIYSPQGNIQPHVDADEADLARRLAELTPQQFRVLGMVCAGLLNKQIAFDLEVSEATIKAHMTAIMRKLGVQTRTQAVMKVGQLQLEGVSEG